VDVCVIQVTHLCVGEAISRGSLSNFIDKIEHPDEGQDDEFTVRASKEKKMDVVAAVKHG